MELIYKEEFYKIKKAAIRVRKTLGNGFLEKVYENALKIELKELGFGVKSQCRFQIRYKHKIIGEYFADLVVEDKIIIELKCVEKLQKIHKAQLINYLNIANFKLGVLINFPNNRAGFRIERIPNLIMEGYS